MDNDLISREALKEALAKEIKTNDMGLWLKILLVIDNAPAVEPFEPDYVGAERLEARQRGYEAGYHYGMQIGKTLNPKIKQGEWIFDSEHTEFGNPYGTYKCNKCGGHSSNKYPFCFWCGAKMFGCEAEMKGGAE